jgi:hypothetical protein
MKHKEVKACNVTVGIIVKPQQRKLFHTDAYISNWPQSTQPLPNIPLGITKTNSSIPQQNRNVFP